MKTFIIAFVLAGSSFAWADDSLIGKDMKCSMTTSNIVTRQNGQSYEDTQSQSKTVRLEGNHDHVFGDFKLRLSSKEIKSFMVEADRYYDGEGIVLSLLTTFGSHEIKVEGSKSVNLKIDRTDITCSLD